MSATTDFAVAIGDHVGAVSPGAEFAPEVILQYDALKKILTEHEVRSSKDGRYLCRPMTGNGGSRSDANAGSWSLLPLDIDELQRNEVSPLIRWAKESRLQGFLSSTFSHTDEKPKVRLWLITSRPTTAQEHAYIFRAMTRLVPFKLDPSMAKPSQPVFCPSCPPAHKDEAFSVEIAGDPLDVDRLLDGYRQEMQPRSEHAGRSGVRQPGGVIDLFNNNFDIRELLQKYKYKPKGLNRFIAPGSKSGRAAVVLYDKTVISFHEPSHDPLAVRGENLQAMVLDAFAAFCALDHGNDFKSAFTSATKWVQEHALVPVNGIMSTAGELPPLSLLNPVEIYSSLRPQDMLVEGVLDQGSVVVVSGDSNSGKTTVSQLLALQIARGEPFANKRVKQGRVLWIAGEDIENSKYRFVAMCEEYKIAPSSLGESLLLLPQPVAILQIESMDALSKAISLRCGAGAKFSAIFVDTKSANWGGADENSNDENAQFVSVVRRKLVAPFGNPSVLLLHHLTKHREKESQSARGGGALINNIDHEWRFEMNQEAHISAMSPGSKVRIERWTEMRFEIKVVNLPVALFPQLLNNFGETPRVSIAEPVNQFSVSIRDLQLEADMRAVVLSAAKFIDAQQTPTLKEIAQDLFWNDADEKPDQRRVRRLIDLAHSKKWLLVNKTEKGNKITGIEVLPAGREAIATEKE